MRDHFMTASIKEKLVMLEKGVLEDPASSYCVYTLKNPTDDYFCSLCVL